MRSLTLPTAVVFGLARLALAADCANTALAVIPSCAQNCLLSAAPAIGCGGSDYDCQCQKTAGLFAAMEECVMSSCSSENYQPVIDGVSTVCDCVNPPVLELREIGTATVSISGSGTYTATATATGGSASPTTGGSTSTATTSGTVVSGSGTTSVWTGYTSVSNVATASVVGGAAAQATPGTEMLRYVVPLAMVGAAVL